MSGFYPYTFSSQIERFGVGKARKVWYNVVFMPDALKKELPFDKYPRLRVDGEIADIPISNAFIPAGDGRNYVIVSPEVMKEAGLSVDDLVEMRLRIADQDHVDIPGRLAHAISRTKKTQAGWDALTPGKRRMLAQHVKSAKTDPTRIKRIEEAISAIRHHKGDLRALFKVRRR
ncbi:MAG: YdeI/OmpD-associated family protein [Pseudomonadota bacterium]